MKINWNKVGRITWDFVSVTMFLGFCFSFWLMAVRENGTHEQRVFWFGEDGARVEEANNAKRNQKCD